MSLRSWLLQEPELVNPLLHVVSHGSASSTTISPVTGSVLSGSTVTFSWSYTGGGTSGPDVAYKYTGKERDGSTDLYFYEARYYDAALGRFISADTIVPDPNDPQSLNRYAYVVNNPLRYTDPTGHCPYHGACPGDITQTADVNIGIDPTSRFDFDLPTIDTSTFNPSGLNTINPSFSADFNRYSIPDFNIRTSGISGNLPFVNSSSNSQLVQPIDVILRAFAPFDSFGLGFKGDGSDRVANTDIEASSRIFGRTSLNSITGDVFDRDVGTSGTSCLGSTLCSFFFGTDVRDADVTNLSFVNNGILTMRITGSNPAFRRGGVNFAPNIDLTLTLDLSNFTGKLTGDRFPSAEVFIRDAVGRSRLLHSFPTQADPDIGPFILLPGSGTDPMGSF